MNNINDIIRSLVEEKLNNSEFFIVDIKVLPNNRISIFLDGDNGINIDKCAEVNRHVLNSLEPELAEKYSLEVSSPGLDQPLKVLRQYKKNVGKEVQVALEDGDQKQGKLLEADVDKLIIEDSSNKHRIHEIAFKKIIKTNIVLSLN